MTTTWIHWRPGASNGCKRMRDLSQRIIPRGVETPEVLGIVLLLRVLARSIFEKYQADHDLLNRILDAYESAANRIAVTVGVSFVEDGSGSSGSSRKPSASFPRPSCRFASDCSSCRFGVLDSLRAKDPRPAVPDSLPHRLYRAPSPES